MLMTFIQGTGNARRISLKKLLLTDAVWVSTAVELPYLALYPYKGDPD